MCFLNRESASTGISCLSQGQVPEEVHELAHGIFNDRNWWT